MLSQTVQLNDNGSAKVCGGNTELRFGYVKNENVYSVNFELSPEWEGLYIRVFWHVPEGDDPPSSLVVDGSVTVPPAVTAITGVGKITLEGTDGTKTITSSDVTYRVYENSGISDGTDPELGSSAWEQFVNEVKADADRAEASAAAAKQSEANAKASETASKLSETNSSTSAAAAKLSETNAKASETEAAKQAEIALQHANTSKENADSSSKNASLASASAAAAKQSETASATSEANAKASENKSLEYMNAAKGYSESASSSAASSEASYRNALKSAQDAAGHASSALSSANESARILGEVKNTASTAQNELNTAKNNYLTELSDAKTSHISDMETKASELTEASKKDIESSKEAALTEIAATNKKLPDVTADDAGKSLLVNNEGTGFVLGDPPVVSYTKEESDARYAPIESAIRPTANGNPAVCEDSVAWSFQGLKVYGKSAQTGTPSPENSVPIVNAGDGGSVELVITGGNICPTSKGSTNFMTNCFVVAETQYTICAKQSVATSFAIQIRDENDSIIASVSIDSYSAPAWATSGYATFTAPKSGKVFINSFAVCEWSELAIYPGALNSRQYNAYQSQSLTVSTPSGLPGIPVESGGNFTDVDGQRLVCDVKDYVTREYTQNCYGVVFDGSEDENWMREEGTDLGYRYYLALSTSCLSSDSENVNSLNSVFKLGASGSTYSTPYVYTISGNNIYVSLSGSETLAEFRDFLSMHPMQLLAVMTTPIVAPIPAEELAAYRALQTYAGTTVVSTTEPVAGIEATYVVDPKKYIDKEVESAVSKAVTSAITLMQGGV